MIVLPFSWEPGWFLIVAVQKNYQEHYILVIQDDVVFLAALPLFCHSLKLLLLVLCYFVVIYNFEKYVGVFLKLQYFQYLQVAGWRCRCFISQ